MTSTELRLIPEKTAELFTPIALAHWIMGDGLKYGNGLILCTDSYKVEEVVRLMNVLTCYAGRFECTLKFHRPGQPRIYIRVSSMPLLQSIVLPYMHTSMLYKLNL